MEIFYSQDIENGTCTLDADESSHCVKVLRHRVGETIHVIDGNGTMFECRITDDAPKHVRAEILSSTDGWGAHPYKLDMAVCPTKNADRYEWFAEKACEIGVDTISPVIGMHSERKVFKESRIRKILVSASKQSLKGRIPAIAGPASVKEFIMSKKDYAGLKLIACCFENEAHPRMSVKDALDGFKGNEVTVMIGPEGDFSAEEVSLAIETGFVPVSLGDSRLRTETAAIAAVSAVYFRYM